MIQPIEQVEELVIGKYYLVDSVILKKTKFGKGVIIPQTLMPIHGPMHNDPEIRFNYEHYHIDWRFVEEKIYKKFMRITSYTMPWQWVLHSDILKRLTITNSNGTFKEYKVAKKVWKCKRQFGTYSKPKWLRELEEKYKDSVMKNFICPHKGLLCNNINPVNGVVICRGHGLAWDVNSGRLVPRAAGPSPLQLEI